MQIFVKTDRTHVLELEEGATASDVKLQLAALHGTDPSEQRLSFAGKQLEDDDILAEAGVQDDSTMYALLRLLGGAKKRKKKTYTKPKKQKHKHKKVKLATLNFYKVDDSGKVQRMRKVCPAETCGAGIFMATHFNRVYCGKCGLTYMYDKEEKA